ncbi:uncharacterized protein [Porites lutea]|uniref:uncharacterized protein n=1 Tax=Porites lutea TaxID=51062 RepID=UPI003CC5B33A
MSKGRLEISSLLVILFITCCTGANVPSPGCKVKNSGKVLQCRGVGLNRIPETIPDGIVVVDLRENNIKHIRHEDAKTLFQFRKVYLSGNPIHCDCSLEWLRLLLVKNVLHAVQDGEHIKCASPLRAGSKALISLSHNQLCGSDENRQKHSFQKRSPEIDLCGGAICPTEINCKKGSKCKCPTGYYSSERTLQRRICININECKMDKTKCDPKKNKGINAKTPCKDTLGSYECVCKPGYELTPDKKDCREMDECKDPVKSRDCTLSGQKCVNTIGGYECKCDPGFKHDAIRKKCLDVNECKIRKHNCSHHSYCQNTHGGFKCVCPKNYELSGTSCIPNDITRWTTPKYLLQDIMDGVWTRLVAAGAAGIIVLSLFVIVVLSCRKMCRKCAERKELKRLAYEEQLMFAAGMYDPDAMFFAEGEMGYPADEIFYPEEMGYLPEGMEYVPEGMGFLPDGMGYAMDNMGYTEDMVYADEMGYNNEMGYPEEIYGTTPTGPMATGENFDHEVPHTYYEDDDENSEGEGQVAS